MKYNEARHKFIQSWGTLGSSWGISKTMAQVHAVLLLSSKPLNQDEIMDILQISRGNASMSLKSLMDWGLIYKEFIPGERKEFYIAEKDAWRIATQVAQERSKRELMPVIHMLDQIKEVKDPTAMKSDVLELKTVTEDILSFAKRSDKMLSTFVKAEKNTFFNKILKLFK